MLRFSEFWMQLLLKRESLSEMAWSVLERKSLERVTSSHDEKVEELRESSEEASRELRQG